MPSMSMLMTRENKYVGSNLIETRHRRSPLVPRRVLREPAAIS